jgi:hypothetical protein
VNVLECIGFERVAKLNKRQSGVPLLSKTATIKDRSQKRVGMWYVTTHSSVDDMKKRLDEIGKELNLLMTVTTLAPSV